MTGLLGLSMSVLLFAGKIHQNAQIIQHLTERRCDKE